MTGDDDGNEEGLCDMSTGRAPVVHNTDHAPAENERSRGKTSNEDGK